MLANKEHITKTTITKQLYIHAIITVSRAHGGMQEHLLLFEIHAFIVFSHCAYCAADYLKTLQNNGKQIFPLNKTYFGTAIRAKHLQPHPLVFFACQGSRPSPSVSGRAQRRHTTTTRCSNLSNHTSRRLSQCVFALAEKFVTFARARAAEPSLEDSQEPHVVLRVPPIHNATKRVHFSIYHFWPIVAVFCFAQPISRMENYGVAYTPPYNNRARLPTQRALAGRYECVQ